MPNLYNLTTPEQHVRFAILVAKEVYNDLAWDAWADRWLSGTDRSEAAVAKATWTAGAAWMAAWARSMAWAAEVAMRAALAAATPGYAALEAALAAKRAKQIDSEIDLVVLAERARTP